MVYLVWKICIALIDQYCHWHPIPEMTLQLMAAQCLLFFIGGFEGTSSALTFLLFELARHPEIQDKLRDEITTVIESNDGQITYDLLKQMPYLDMVLAG